jgi:ribosome-binding factor A
MPRRKISRRDLLAACAQPSGEDGRDPRLDRRERSGKVPNRKALQLCAQVARTLMSVLADCGDDVLRDLLIESVTPAPNASRLLVTVRPMAPHETEVVPRHLQRAHGKLRMEAAAAIHRRRAPDLLFRVRETTR